MSALPTHEVKAIIINEQNDILLLQRNPALRGIDNWDLPGGLVEESEHEQEALLREVQEECGVTITLTHKGKTWSFKRDKDAATVTVQNYYAHITHGDIQLSEEHIQYAWVPQNKVRTYPVKDNQLYEAI